MEKASSVIGKNLPIVNIRITLKQGAPTQSKKQRINKQNLIGSSNEKTECKKKREGVNKIKCIRIKRQPSGRVRDLASKQLLIRFPTSLRLQRRSRSRRSPSVFVPVVFWIKRAGAGNLYENSVQRENALDWTAMFFSRGVGVFPKVLFFHSRFSSRSLVSSFLRRGACNFFTQRLTESSPVIIIEQRQMLPPPLFFHWFFEWLIISLRWLACN